MRHARDDRIRAIESDCEHVSTSSCRDRICASQVRRSDLNSQITSHRRSGYGIRTRRKGDRLFDFAAVSVNVIVSAAEPPVTVTADAASDV